MIDLYYRLSLRMKLILFMGLILVGSGFTLYLQISKLIRFQNQLNLDHGLNLKHLRAEADLRLSLNELVHNSIGLIEETVLFADAQATIIRFVQGDETTRSVDEAWNSWKGSVQDGKGHLTADLFQEKLNLVQSIDEHMGQFLQAIKDVTAGIEDSDEDDFDPLDINSAVSKMSYLGLALENEFRAIRQLESELTKATMEEEQQLQAALNRQMLFVFILCVLVSCVFMYWIAGQIVKPLARLGGLMADFLESGQLDERFDSPLKDEVGKLGGSFNDFMEKLSEIIVEINQNALSLSSAATQLSQVSNDMESSVTVNSKGTSSVGQATRSLHHSMKDMGLAAGQVNRSVRELRNTTTEMTDQIVEVSAHANVANSTANEAVVALHDAEAKITNLKKSIHDIRDFTDIITDISKRTNLLALNATIEAARSGEAGVGFTVVASEIKELANQSNNAADDIVERIKVIISNMNVLEENMTNALSVIDQAQTKVAAVAELMNNQKSGIENITSNTALVAQGIETVDHNMNQGIDLITEIAQDLEALVAQNTGLEENSRAIKENASELTTRSKLLHDLTDQYQMD